MGHSGSVQRHRGSRTRNSNGALYGEPVDSGDGSNSARAQYTPAQLQAMYLSRGRPDMGFMANQSMLPKEVPEMQQTCTVKNHVNLKKGSLKLLPLEDRPHKFDLELVFDATKPCRIQIFMIGQETIDDDTGCSSYALVHENQLVISKEFDSGLAQKFALSDIDEHLDFSGFPKSELVYESGSLKYPLIVVLEVLASEDNPQSQTTFATFFERNNSWDVKMLKQKIQVDGLTYELQEIYGIDGAIAAQPKEGEAEADQKGTIDEVEIPDGAECIICMCEPRNTTVLPCRHMCLCGECAEHLRKNASTCPICRTRVEALLQIRVEAKDDDKKDAEG